MSRGARHSLLLQRVLETTDSVLDLAFDLVGLAVGLQLGIAYRLADGLLDRALDLLRRSRDPILIHDYNSYKGHKFRSSRRPYRDGAGCGRLGKYLAPLPPRQNSSR